MLAGHFLRKLEAVPDHSTISQRQRRKMRTKQLKRDKRRTHKRVSGIDLETGHVNRPGKLRGQRYLSHQTIGTDNGIIIGLTVTPEDADNSAPYLEQLEHIHKNVSPLQAAEADSAYDFPLPTAYWGSTALISLFAPSLFMAVPQRYLCRPEMGHNLTHILRRGLEAAEDHCLLFCCSFEPQKNDTGCSLTPEDVFFLSFSHGQLLFDTLSIDPLLPLGSTVTMLTWGLPLIYFSMTWADSCSRIAV